VAGNASLRCLGLLISLLRYLKVGCWGAADKGYELNRVQECSDLASFEDIDILPSLRIPGSELLIEFSRSTGPGGQHVNKVETRVTICFDIDSSTVLNGHQRGLLKERLRSRINKDGILRVSCEESRSQAGNRELVRTRFVEVLRQALKSQKKRIPTKATRASQRRRMDQKKKRGDIKRGRGSDWGKD